jgi:hypothetical protein
MRSLEPNRCPNRCRASVALLLPKLASCIAELQPELHIGGLLRRQPDEFLSALVRKFGHVYVGRPIVRPKGPGEFSPGLSVAMPWERRSSPQSALEGRERAGGKILAALQAAGMCNLFTQGIAALSPGLDSPGPLGRLDGRIPDTYSYLCWPALSRSDSPSLPTSFFLLVLGYSYCAALLRAAGS